MQREKAWKNAQKKTHKQCNEKNLAEKRKKALKISKKTQNQRIEKKLRECRKSRTNFVFPFFLCVWKMD